MSRAALLNLPNALSLSRLALVPFFVASSATGTRVALVAAAAVTDLLDGWLARRRGVATRLGAILDPIADRTFVLAALAVLVAEGALGVWQCAVLLTRDVATTVGFVVARVARRLRAVELQARLAGKVTTALQVAALLAVLLAPRLVPALVAAVGVVSLAAVADYTRMLWQGRRR
jgi:CDP-diacylglycerol--glycerol-3-phosphate 3-phosphatidyltransferase/cardiolipin synthase